MKQNFLAAGLVGLLVTLGWLAGAGAAMAQPVPPGSYLRSCRDAQVRHGNDLVANCAMANGAWVRARLENFPSCRGDISNQNGQLWCERRPMPPPPPPGPGGFGPPGSYQNSCTQIRFRNGILNATCQTMSGAWRPASLNVANCARGGDIANNNGRLVCPPPAPPPVPPGSYLRSCSDAIVGPAGTLWAQCRRMDGGWNRASLNLNNCRGTRDIANINGRLVCN